MQQLTQTRFVSALVTVARSVLNQNTLLVLLSVLALAAAAHVLPLGQHTSLILNARWG